MLQYLPDDIIYTISLFGSTIHLGMVNKNFNKTLEKEMKTLYIKNVFNSIIKDRKDIINLEYQPETVHPIGHMAYRIITNNGWDDMFIPLANRTAEDVDWSFKAVMFVNGFLTVGRLFCDCLEQEG